MSQEASDKEFRHAGHGGGFSVSGHDDMTRQRSEDAALEPTKPDCRAIGARGDDQVCGAAGAAS